MTTQSKLLCAAVVTGVAALLASAPAQALTSQEGSAKYQAAKKDGKRGATEWENEKHEAERRRRGGGRDTAKGQK